MTLNNNRKLVQCLFVLSVCITILSNFNINCVNLNDRLYNSLNDKSSSLNELSLESEISLNNQEEMSFESGNSSKNSNTNKDDKNTSYQNERVIINANGTENPMIPVAAGIGGEVIIACVECRKIVGAFLQRCVDQEAGGKQADTLRSFCESFRDKPTAKINPETCLILNAKLASVTGESGDEVVDPTKAPNLCIKFMSQCQNFGDSPNCFSGYCEQVAECIDCPHALVDKNKNGDFTQEVCGNSGVCRLGWKAPNSKGGNGYCDCKNNMKGLACNEY
jgi:hypothetical protein